MKKGINKLTLLFFFIITGFLYGQSSGKISGTVTDESTGEPVIGANIIIEGTYIGAATDVNGEYVIVNVPPGTYTITASYIGYAKTQIKNVKVMVDLTTHLNIKMSSTTITMGNEVVVVAQAPLVIKDMTSTESRVSAEEINSLPIQDLNQLVTLQAGVSKDANGGLHIRGGRSSEISYLVNGVSITDDYNRTQALTVDPESVQELQVISGTFNAEYGNAMSGVVNVVTKTGGSKFQGNLELWTGDYVSTHQGIFMHIKDFSPIANYNFQGSVSGPILTDKLTYFFTARRYFDGGYIYGRNIYNPEGRVKFFNGELVPNPGDSSYVSMNSSARWSGQGTIDWRISKDFRFKLDAFGSTSKDQYYDHLFQLDPHGAKGGNSNGYSFFSTLTHFLGANTYQQLTAAYKYNDYKSWLYDNPFDPRYVSPDSSNVQGFHFATAGNDLNRFQRSTKSYILKWDLASQVDNVNFVKLGVNAQYDKLFYENINLVPALNASGQQIVPFVPDILGTDSPQHDRFNRHPFNFSAYVQDKIEFESVIINVGLRFDLFNPYGKIPIDQTDPNVYNPFKLEHIYHDLNNDGKISLDEQTDANKYTLAEREAFWYKNTTVKTGLSPRFGIAYPITDKGIIRFSFGIFQQIPDYSQLYLNDQFKLTSTQGVQGPFGNNDLNPQRTTIYELGLQQQLTQDLAIDLTAYYRDIRDWISSSQPIQTFLAGVSYSKRINRDFANVRGITLSVNKRFTNYFSFGVDYTFQIAEGTNSSPDEEFYAQQNGAEPKRYLTPLNWDQTHTFNANLYAGAEGWGLSVISSLITGQPYTPTFTAGAYTGRNVLTGLAENSRRKPIIANIDLELTKDISLLSADLQFFIKVFNLLDAKNPTTVFTDSGQPDYTLQEKTVTNYDKGWFVYPDYYSRPRSVYVGTKISIK